MAKTTQEPEEPEEPDWDVSSAFQAQIVVQRLLDLIVPKRGRPRKGIERPNTSEVIRAASALMSASFDKWRLELEEQKLVILQQRVDLHQQRLDLHRQQRLDLIQQRQELHQQRLDLIHQQQATDRQRITADITAEVERRAEARAAELAFASERERERQLRHVRAVEHAHHAQPAKLARERPNVTANANMTASETLLRSFLATGQPAPAVIRPPSSPGPLRLYDPDPAGRIARTPRRAG